LNAKSDGASLDANIAYKKPPTTAKTMKEHLVQIVNPMNMARQTTKEITRPKTNTKKVTA